MIRLFKRITWHLLFWSLLASALSLTVLRLALQGIGHFQQEITGYVSEMLGTPLSIGRLTTKMRGITPELRLKDIVIVGKELHQPAIELQEIRIRLDLWSLLANRELLPATAITLVGTHLTVQRNQDGSFSVTGLKAGDGQPVWLLQGSHYQMLQSTIVFRDLQHPDKSLEPTKIDLAINNAGNQHTLNATVKLPPRYGGSLDLAMAFTGNFFTAEPINGRAYIAAHEVQPSDIIRDNFPALGKPDVGSLDSKLWVSLTNSELSDVQGDIHLTPHGKNQANTLFSRFHWYRLNQNKARWQLDVPKLALTAPQVNAASDNRFSVAADFSLDDWAWSIQHLNLADAAHIGAWLAPSPFFKRLMPYRLSGSLEQFSGMAKRDNAFFAMKGNFNHIRFASVNGQPAINGLSGTIVGNQRQGAVTLSSKQAKFDYPTLFRQALTFNQLTGSVHWQQNDNEWLLSSPSLKMALPGIRGEGKLRLTLSKQENPPFLDWQMVLTNPDVSQLKRYLPAKAMNQVDVDWFDAAFSKGRIEKGRILYYGPLGPLKSAAFRALLDVNDVELSYDPEWPRLTGLKGRVTFLQNKMICEISRGHSLNLAIGQATVTHPAISASKHLLIEGKVSGTLPATLAFLDQTELKEDVGGIIKAIQTQGQTDISLDIGLALNPHTRTRINGKAALKSAKLNIKAIDLWLENISGVLKFNENGIYSDTIKATAFKRPTTIKITHDDRKTKISARGQANINELKNQFTLPLWDHAQGTLAYQLQMDLPRDDSPAVVNVSSNLREVSLDFPAPFAKTKGQIMPLTVSFILEDGPLLPITLNYDNQFKAAIKLDTLSEQLYSGYLLWGEGSVRQASGNNLNVEINYPNLDLSLLGALSATSSPQADNSRPAFTHLRIKSNKAQWKKQPIGPLRLSLDLENDNWAGNIQSAIAQGKVKIPVNLNPNGIVNIDLKLLDLSPFEASDSPQTKTPSPAKTTTLQPEQMPLLFLTSQKFLWRGVDLGRLSLFTERTKDGMSIKQGSLNGAGQQLEFSGRWKNSNGATLTEVDGSLSSAKTGQLLSQLDITEDIKETEGTLHFYLNWQGSPFDFELANLSGKLETDLQNGRILSIEPGFGRVLGLFAMAQWSKRLQLDFRDIFADGLSFNQIKGTINIKQGTAHTDKLVVDAIPATVSIIGDADLINKTLNQTVRVVPKSADALPIAGTIIDSVVDIASRTLTGKSGEGLFLGSEYRLEGNWHDIKIIPTRDNDGLVKKTLDTLTDLPWLPSNTNNNKTDDNK